MEWFIKAFIRASLVWFALGIVVGLAMAMHPAWVIYRPAHAHMNVAGFLTMLVFGVGYQLLPRLFGHPLHSPRLAAWHLYCANVGLAGLVIGFVLQAQGSAAALAAMAGGGTLYAAGVVLWVYNLWRTFDAADARAAARARDGRPGLPTIGE
ncbi:MAG TPA: cbb3-type cytochrome c oxidase subunit I [Gemmatimonadaceae bacterium]|nr:cbb3-type cytochrome c oxidase subunit I [Gemmatimonadaceae bacterium]